MRVRVSDPATRDDLAAYLRGGEFDVLQLGSDMLDVGLPRARNEDEARDDLRHRLAVWRTMRPTDRAEILD